MYYEETKQLIRDIPRTMIPGLLRLMVETAIQKNVFPKGHIAEFVRRVEDDAENQTQTCQSCKPV